MKIEQKEKKDRKNLLTTPSKGGEPAGKVWKDVGHFAPAQSPTTEQLGIVYVP
jgi:hypothetical protein